MEASAQLPCTLRFELPTKSTPPTQRKQVHFGSPGDLPTAAAKRPVEGQLSGGGWQATGEERHAFDNKLFSPGQQDSIGAWTINAQLATHGMEQAGNSAGLAPRVDADGTPASSVLTPASTAYLESVRQVDGLRGRLASLEQALKDMESKAVAHLDNTMQEKVLATAAKIVQKRFLADKQLDKKVEAAILQTAIKVAKRQGAVVAEAEDANPTRKLQFEGQDGPGSSSAQVQQYLAHIEQGLGEVVRRLERKVESVASLLDQNALELLEARLASGVVRLEERMHRLEARESLLQAAVAPVAEPSRQLLDRVVAVETAVAEQGHALTDLLAALHVRAAVATPGDATDGPKAAHPAGASEVPAPAVREPPAVGSPAADAATPLAAMPAAAREPGTAQPPKPAQQLHRRRVAAAKRTVLEDVGRTGAAPPGPAVRRLESTHGVGTAQQFAMAKARQQLARQSTRALEEAGEAPVWVSMVHVFGWTLLVLLGMAAILIGCLAVLVKNGRLSEVDFDFLWK